MFSTLRDWTMENNYEWQAVIGIAIFAGSWIGLSFLSDWLRSKKRERIRRKHRIKILKAIQRLGDD